MRELARRVKKNSDFIPIAILLLLAWVFFFYRLGSMALIGPDEPRYAQVAREMLQRRDMITPTIGGHRWLEKPPLLYWLMMASIAAFGTSEFAARLPSALSAVMIVLLVYRVGRRVSDALLGFLSATALIVNPMFFSFARAASTDMLLCSTMSAGLCLFVAAVADRGSRWAHAALLSAYACFGLAVLAKGLVGVLLPGATILIYLILVGQKLRIKDLEVVRGTILLLLIVGSWFVPVTMGHGWLFVQEFFISHHFERFLTNKFHHPGPIYYYLPVILVGTVPWTSFFVSSVLRFRWGEVREVGLVYSRLITASSRCTAPFRQSSQVKPTGGSSTSTEGYLSPTDQRLHSDAGFAAVRWFFLLWVLVPLLFFSLSSSKLPGYLLPVMPAASFLIGDELRGIVSKSRWDRQSRVALSITPAIVLAVAGAAVAYAWREVGGPWWMQGLILISAAAMAVVSAGAVLWDHTRLAVESIVVGCALIALIVVHGYQPLVEKKESFRDFAAVALANLKENEKVVGYLYYHHSLTFYTNARSIYDINGNAVIARSPEDLLGMVREEGSVLVLTKDEALLDLRSDQRFTFEVLWSDRGFTLLRCLWKEREQGRGDQSTNSMLATAGKTPFS